MVKPATSYSSAVSRQDMTTTTKQRAASQRGALLLLVLLTISGHCVDGIAMPRRSALATAAATIASAVTPFESKADEKNMKVYQVRPDASKLLNPTLKTIRQPALIAKLSKQSGAVWLGEHHNENRDHVLQTQIIRELHSSANRPMAIGLEQVQIQFQPALDDYIKGSISLEKMRELVEWNTRWQWPFEQYQPIFETARELQVSLIALNVNSEDLVLVENGGLPNLSKLQFQRYIPDPRGFGEFAQTTSFKTYVDYVIRPSYDVHKAMGLLEYSLSGQKLAQPISFRNFFSSRVLWDESMGHYAHEWTKANPNGLLIGLVGADHVKFGMGVPGRYQRFASADATTKSSCTSIMLNPSLIDTRPSGSVDMANNNLVRTDQITLQLRYLKDEAPQESRDTGGVLPLADYLVVTA